MTIAGLPEEGPGSIAPAHTRLGGFLIDILSSAVVAFLFTAPELPQNRSLLVFGAFYFGFTVLAQATPGMRLLRMRVIRTDQPVPVGAWRALLRTVGVILLIPAVLRGNDGRALHDRFTQTAVVRG